MQPHTERVTPLFHSQVTAVGGRQARMCFPIYFILPISYSEDSNGQIEDYVQQEHKMNIFIEFCYILYYISQ